MPHRKAHVWQAIKGVTGTFKCQRCGMIKHQFGKKAIYARPDGRLDKSDTKLNCFILSKD